MNTIKLNEVLAYMNSIDNDGKRPYYNLKVRAFQTNSQFGGRLIEYKNVRTALENNSKSENEKLKKQKLKDPNHFKNRTRNIVTMNKEVKTIHILFIVEFNGQRVIL